MRGRPWRGYVEWARKLHTLAYTTWVAGGTLAFIVFLARARYGFFACFVWFLLDLMKMAALGGGVWGISKLLLMVGQGFWHEPADESQ
ncbi:MAG: hypothetical protein JW889_06655 [Verrucomicrobia bacterium]|nr:hypothetical protein [Verrucomicrobiota bacterium]